MMALTSLDVAEPEDPLAGARLGRSSDAQRLDFVLRNLEAKVIRMRSAPISTPLARQCVGIGAGGKADLPGVNVDIQPAYGQKRGDEAGVHHDSGRWGLSMTDDDVYLINYDGPVG
jgi:hypothetical protein